MELQDLEFALLHFGLALIQYLFTMPAIILFETVVNVYAIVFWT